jgi:hypothetical protein
VIAPSETSTDFLLYLYFSNSSFAGIIIIRYIWVLEEVKKIILTFEETLFEPLEILMQMCYAFI